MRIDRNAAAIVVDRQKSVGAQFHFNEGGVSRQRLVHGVVDDFGEQMMQRLLVGAADIHAGPACISAAPTRRRCIICSPKSSTTPWTRRWRDTPPSLKWN